MIKRQSLRNQVADAVWSLMLQGELSPGSRLNETVLSTSLGISRTPLREALLQLERDGFLTSTLGKGFHVKTLSQDEVSELYPLRALLEPYALRLAGLPDRSTLAALKQAHTELSELAPSTEWIDRDEEFHEMLFQQCPNAHLLLIIDSLRRHSRRYITVFLGNSLDLQQSCQQHGRVVERLEQGNLSAACEMLAENIMAATDHILHALESKRLSPASASLPGDGVPSRVGSGRPTGEGALRTLTVGVTSPTDDLDLDSSFEIGSSMILAQIFEAPYAPSFAGETPAPLLFNGPLRVEDEHGLVLSASLRRDIRFADGSTLSSAQLIDHLAATEPIRRQASVTNEGDRVVFHLERPNANFVFSLTLLQCAVAKKTEELTLGTGPYMLDPDSPADAIRLLRNPYSRNPPNIDEVIFRAYPPDEDGRPTHLLAAIESGEVDLTYSLSRQDLPPLHGVSRRFEPGNSTAMLSFNTQRGSIAERSVRTALAMAIDRTDLAADSSTGPFSIASPGLLPPVLGGLNDGIQFDLATARQVLSEARSVSEKPLRLCVVWCARPYLSDPLAVAERVREHASRLGLEIEVMQARSRAEFLDTIVSGDYDLVLAGHHPETPDPADAFESLLSSHSIPKAGHQLLGKLNLSRLESSEMDRALLDFRAEPTANNRSRVLELVRREMPVLPLMYGSKIAVHSRRLKGYRPSICGRSSFVGLSLDG